MVEPIYVRPRTRAMARLAAKHAAIRPAPLHAPLEFAPVRIRMARRATTVREPEGKNFVPPARGACLVAFRACDRHVRARQRILRVLMLRDRKRRSVEINHRVALLAPIFIRLRSELPIVRVLVAIQARREFHLVDRLFPGRNVTLGALHLDVHSFEGIFRCRMFLYSEK